MIIQTISEYAFIEAFSKGSYKYNFSYEGLEALYKYLEELSEDIGEHIQLDVVAICCDYCEIDKEDLESTEYEVIAELSNNKFLCRSC